MSSAVPSSSTSSDGRAPATREGTTEVTGGRPVDKAWYRLTAAEVTTELDVDPAVGLSSAAVAERTERYGSNRLTEPPSRPKWLRFLDQFRSGIVYILIAAAVISGLVGDLKDPIVIGVVLLINAILGYVQEGRAESAMDALREMLVATVRVRRDGQLVEVATDDLVPGDIVLLEAGDRIPADGRLLVAANASVDESVLTGESVTVDKQVEPVGLDSSDDLPLGDRLDCVFMNTTVGRGRLEMVVTDTGMTTQMGRVAELLNQADPGPTPLEKQIDDLSRRLAIIAILAVSVVFALSLFQGNEFGDALLSAVALAVAAIPEGLPAVVTVTLALGVSQMAKKNAIVKRLHSVETLGSTTAICSDKTGTLTMNQMAVTDVVADDRDHALLVGVLCNDAEIRDGALVGDPTEGAFVAEAQDGGLDVGEARRLRPRVGEVPFDSSTKYMATYHRTPGSDRLLLCVKGAPDVVMGRCATTADAIGDAEATNEGLASQGRRVLAVASRWLEADEVLDADGAVADPDRWVDVLHLDGLVGIIDPPRPEARDAIALCHAAGIEVRMITGDHAVTAGAIAAELGITGRVISGAEMDAMTDEELAAQIESIGVCARVSPEHKVRVVLALRANGHVVAMTGDGVNDAPALRTADIGIAMGITGTEVTKEAGDMVLADDNFATIVNAVEQGRTIYDNIVKFVRFQLATNLAAISTILIASFMGHPTLFTPIQLLWVNLIADGPPAMSLGTDPPEDQVMQRQPRATDAAILPVQRIARLMFVALVMAAGTLGVYTYADNEWGDDVALTMTFTVFVVFQLFNAFNARRESKTVFTMYSLRNRTLWLALAAVLGLQIMAVSWGPVQGLFDTTGLTLAQWGICVAVATTVVWAEELRKVVARLIRPKGDETPSAPLVAAGVPAATGTANATDTADTEGASS